MSMLRYLLLFSGLWVMGCAAPGGPRQNDVDCLSCGEIRQISQTLMTQEADAGNPLSGIGEDWQILPLPERMQESSERLLSTGLPSVAPEVPVRQYRVDAVDLQMDDGSMRRIMLRSSRGLSVGQRVRIVGERLLPLPPGG